MQQRLVVIGSSNTDMVIQAEHLPKPGETILGGKFFMNPGGKGANQAVAAARLGGKVTFICKTGNDIFGEQAKAGFDNEGIDTRFVFSDPVHPSGVALITLDQKGENSIVVAQGSNSNLTIEDIRTSLPKVENPACVLIQLEIPLQTVKFAAEFASSKRIMVILNPAPATRLPDSLLQQINIITPNEIEAEMLTGIVVNDKRSAEQAAEYLNGKGVDTVVITRGDEGALLYHEGVFTHIPVVPVDPVDTTAAGDVFNGALAVALCEGSDVKDAVAFACRAAAISVTRIGAQASAPYRNELT